MKKLLLYGFLFNSTLINCQSSQGVEDSNHKPNILFIAVDDLRPEIGAYGSEIAITPNFDRLASKSLLFENAYCQEAICSPSRASVMTGLRPERVGVVENFTYFRDVNPNVITIPQHLKANGYETVYSGKIFHPGYTDEELSWSTQPEKVVFDENLPQLIGGYASTENQTLFRKIKKETQEKANEDFKYGLGRGPAYECIDVPDNTYPDGKNTQIAIATLNKLVKQDKPFFLAMGYKLPHLDWNAPKKYWDLYDRNKIMVNNNQTSPKDGASIGLHESFELRTRYGIPKEGKIDTALAIDLKHAYLASVSYIDAQLGKLIDELEKSGQAKNTIIVLWSDHGWHLGDMGIWGKATNYEIATRVPFMIYAPQYENSSSGKKTQSLAELIDIFPTLCDLTGVKMPEGLQGTSLVPVLKNSSTKVNAAAFSQFPTPALREWAANPLSEGMRKTFFGPLITEVEGRIKTQFGKTWNRSFFENDLMGYSIRTERYRLIVWKQKGPEGEPLYYELFDHENDPNERNNIAKDNPKIIDDIYGLMDIENYF